MNLAEQIKNEIRQENPIDYDGMTKVFTEIFTKDPSEIVRLYFRNVEEIKVSKCVITDVTIPYKWMIDVKQWAKENGFGVWDVLHSCTHEVRYTEVTLR